jgi:hypothetical protein
VVAASWRRLLPAWQSHFIAARRAHPRPLDIDLAATKAGLAAGATLAITAPANGAAMTRPAGFFGVPLYHGGNCFLETMQRKTKEIKELMQEIASVTFSAEPSNIY